MCFEHQLDARYNVAYEHIANVYLGPRELLHLPSQEISYPEELWNIKRTYCAPCLLENVSQSEHFASSSIYKSIIIFYINNETKRSLSVLSETDYIYL